MSDIIGKKKWFMAYIEDNPRVVLNNKPLVL